MKRRICALVCALILCVSLVPAHALTEGDIYFTAVNDSLLPLTVDDMLVWVNGRLYVPAWIFDKNVTGSTLNLNYNRSGEMLTLYTLQGMLVFDLNRNIVYDQSSGQNLSPRAVIRNNQTYLPVELVCDFFQLEDTYTYTKWGYLLRIKDSNRRLTDARFLDAAGSIMNEWLQEIMAAQNPGSVDQPDDPQVDPPNPVVPGNETQVCLAFRCESAEGLENILDILDGRAWRALFFFQPETLLQQDDLVRRVVGSGHGVGLIASAETGEPLQEQLKRGNEMLAHIARTATTVALAPSQYHGQLEREGWVCWNETMDASPRAGERVVAFSQRVIQTVGTTKQTVYLTMDGGTSTASVLSTLLRQLTQRGYTMLTPLESRL